MGKNNKKVVIDLKQLKKDYLSGVQVTKIAKTYNTTIQTIYSRLKILGITKTNSESHMGQSPWNKANGHITKDGYRQVWHKGKPIREHLLVAEKMIGRKLNKGEVVHHINGIGHDNRPENLRVFKSQSEHMKHHAALKALGVEVVGEERE